MKRPQSRTRNYAVVVFRSAVDAALGDAFLDAAKGGDPLTASTEKYFAKIFSGDGPYHAI
jgi:hypothetical protein